MSAHGVLLVDKIAGETSTDVVRMVKKAFNTKKVGHTGTLDLFATGLLPICLGEALKYSRWLLDARKTYEFTLSLGTQTDTADCTGEVIAKAAVPTFLNLKLACERFQGDIKQIPPKYSALKIHGKRAYELARNGEFVELAPRQVTIFSLTLTQQDCVTLIGSTMVSKGTYIRTLCEDIANELGTVGHCKQLRRTVVMPYSLSNQTVTTNELRSFCTQVNKSSLQAKLLPIDSLCRQFSELVLDDNMVDALRQGKKIHFSEKSVNNGVLYRLYTKNNQFIGLGEQNNNQLKAFRLMRY